IGSNIPNMLLPTRVTAIASDYSISVAMASASLTISIMVLADGIPTSAPAPLPTRRDLRTRQAAPFAVVIVKPVTVVLKWLMDTMTWIVSKGEIEKASVSKDELRTVVDIADSEGVFAKHESYRIRGVLDFR